MDTAIKTSKLSIYLIKEEYTSPETILRNFTALKKEDISKVGILFYKNSHKFTPSWVKKFFNNSIEADIVNSTSSAILLVHTENRFFAITFGYGHTLLNPGICEERFGLKVTLNVTDHENIRSIDKKNMSNTPKLVKEQATKEGAIANFDIDIEQDLIQGVTVKSKDERFGKTITGKDALGVSVKINISNIEDFLKLCFEKYHEDTYKENYAWIDNIYEVKDPKEIEKLNEEMIRDIKSENIKKTWMAIPKIIEWQDVSEFRIRKSSKEYSFGNDIDIPQYLSFLSEEEKQNLSLETLKNQKIECISATSDKEKDLWTVYSCLYCEVEKPGNKTYILNDGKWYQIEKDFVKEVNNAFDSFKKESSNLDIPLPKCNKNEHEGMYNERVAKENSENIHNMDKKIIQHGGMKQKIEFCDLFTKNKEMIHVKKYGASSVLSHLFSQGLVSGKLFHQDQEFRKKLNSKLPNGYKLPEPEREPNPANYKIIFAVISNSKKEFDLPFFSKVNMRIIMKDLKSFGYPVYIIKIPVVEE